MTRRGRGEMGQSGIASSDAVMKKAGASPNAAPAGNHSFQDVRSGTSISRDVDSTAAVGLQQGGLAAMAPVPELVTTLGGDESRAPAPPLPPCPRARKVGVVGGMEDEEDAARAFEAALVRAIII